MSHSAAESSPLSSPLSSPPPSSPEQASSTGSSPPAQPPAQSIVQSDGNSTTTARQESPVQAQQAPASESVAMNTSTSNISARRASKQSPKRAREEDSDSEDAFGTLPPKRATKTKRIANSKTATKKAASPRKPASKKPVPKKTPAKEAAPAPTSARPSRSRKAPERFEHQEKPAPKALPIKKEPSKVFDPVFITTNSTSRLGKADVYHMLLEGSAWTSLSAEQQKALVSMLPQDAANQAVLAKIDAGETESTRPSAFTLANDCFRTDVAKFKDDLKNGHLAKTWQAAAEQAVTERAAGDYDEWKAQEAESWWGQKSK
jgi:hypothetical protein